MVNDNEHLDDSVCVMLREGERERGRDGVSDGEREGGRE